MRKFLEGLEFEKELIDTIMAEHGKHLTKHKEDAEDFKTQLGEVQQKLTAFADVDVDALKGEIVKLQGDLTQKDTDHQAKISDMAFNSALSAAVGGMKGKSAKAITAMLDLDALKGSNNQETDIKAALEALKESDAYLFDTEQVPPHYAGGTGKDRLSAPTEKDQIMQAAKEAMQIK